MLDFASFRDAALCYVSANFILMAAHHVRHWTSMSHLLTEHQVLPEFFRASLQAALSLCELMIGGAAMYALFANAFARMALSAGIVAALGFVTYVGMLRRAGVASSCGCYFVGDAEARNGPSWIPSSALLVVSAVGLLAVALGPSDDVSHRALLERAPSILLGVSGVMLVQTLGVLKALAAIELPAMQGTPS